MAYINKINVDGVEYEVQDKNALPSADLPEAINTALAQAKESGEFDGEPGSDYVLTESDKQEIAELAAELVPSGGGGSFGEVWCDDVLAEGTLIANNAVLYDTGITLAKLREYKSFVYKLKGASNTNLSNLYLDMATDETQAASHKGRLTFDRGNDSGRIAYYQWANKDKTILRPVNGYSGNTSMVYLGATANSGQGTQVYYGTGQYNVMQYIDTSARATTDKLFFSCTNIPSIDYAFEIRGLTK